MIYVSSNGRVVSPFIVIVTRSNFEPKNGLADAAPHRSFVRKRNISCASFIREISSQTHVGTRFFVFYRDNSIGPPVRSRADTGCPRPDAMANLKILSDVTVDEIALEGMDGLTIDSKTRPPTLKSPTRQPSPIFSRCRPLDPSRRPPEMDAAAARQSPPQHLALHSHQSGAALLRAGRAAAATQHLRSHRL